jgi:hypothetical protein
MKDKGGSLPFYSRGNDYGVYEGIKFELKRYKLAAPFG